MLKISSTIGYRGGVVQKMPDFPEMMKTALSDAIILYHRKFLPHHFGTLGQVESLYPGIYKARDKHYMKRKARLQGHQNMLMWSGKSAMGVLSQISITGTHEEAKGRMKGANRNFNFSGVDKTGRVKPMMNVELLYTNKEEGQEQAEIVDKHVQEFLDKDTPVEMLELGWIG